MLPVMVDAQGYLDLDFGVPVPEIPSIHPRKALNYPSGVLARWNFIVMTGKGKADQIRRDLMCECSSIVHAALAVTIFREIVTVLCDIQ